MRWKLGENLLSNGTEKSETESDLFGHATMAELAAIGSVSDPAQIERLRKFLTPIASHYRRVISTTPSDLEGSPSTDTLSDRLAWIDAQVLNPLTKLLDAIEPEKRAMFSLWPEEVGEELIPDFEEVKKQLKHLQVLGWNVAIVIAKYRHYGLPFGQLLQFRIVAEIVAALATAWPNVKMSRGTYDKETKGYNGIYPDLVRRIFKEITGLDEQLDHLIKEQVDSQRK